MSVHRYWHPLRLGKWTSLAGLKQQQRGHIFYCCASISASGNVFSGSSYEQGQGCCTVYERVCVWENMAGQQPISSSYYLTCVPCRRLAIIRLVCRPLALSSLPPIDQQCQANQPFSRVSWRRHSKTAVYGCEQRHSVLAVVPMLASCKQVLLWLLP